MIARHEDHDPALICRPAGYGLCEVWIADQQDGKDEHDG